MEKFIVEVSIPIRVELSTNNFWFATLNTDFDTDEQKARVLQALVNSQPFVDFIYQTNEFDPDFQVSLSDPHDTLPPVTD